MTLSFHAGGPKRSFDKKNKWSKTGFLVTIILFWAPSLKYLQPTAESRGICLWAPGKVEPCYSISICNNVIIKCIYCFSISQHNINSLQLFIRYISKLRQWILIGGGGGGLFHFKSVGGPDKIQNSEGGGFLV